MAVDQARHARVLGLMAANGFGVATILDMAKSYLTTGKDVPWPMIVALLAAFGGLAANYVSLLPAVPSRARVNCEFVSAAIVAFLMALLAVNLGHRYHG